MVELVPGNLSALLPPPPLGQGRGEGASDEGALLSHNVSVSKSMLSQALSPTLSQREREFRNLLCRK
jgi:hypothetical protein